MTGGGGLWFSDLRPDVTGPRLRLLCFPHAGGAPEVFHGLAARLPAGVAAEAVLLPGRGRRLGEPPVHSLRVLAIRIVRELRARRAELGDQPLVLLGYSMGALLAYEVARQLAAAPDAPVPAKLLVCAHNAPGFAPPRVARASLGREEFADELRRMDGTPTEILDRPDVFEVFLPTLRADFAAAEGYVPPAAARLAVPVCVIGSRTDPETCPDGLRAWQATTSARCSWDWVPGGHFFLSSHEGEFAAAVLRRLAAAEQAPDLPQGVEAGLQSPVGG